MWRAVSACAQVSPTANRPSPGTTTMIGAAPVAERWASTRSRTSAGRPIGSASAGRSSSSGCDPAYTIWSGVSGPPSTKARPPSVAVKEAATGSSSNARIRRRASVERCARSVGARVSTRARAVPASTALGQGGRRRGRDGSLDPLDQPGRRVLDVACRVAGDDQPVVREQRETRWGRARPCLVLGSGGADRVGEGQARVRVGHPDHAVPEEPPGKLGPVPVAADGVHEDRVRMEHEALGKQRVEQELDRGASPARGCQPCFHGHAHHGIVAGVHHGRVALEHLQQARRVQRHERIGLEGGQGDAAGLDPEDAVGLGGGVAAAAAREPRVLAEPARERDQLVQDRGGMLGIRLVHHCASPLVMRAAPSSRNQPIRLSVSGKPAAGRPSASTKPGRPLARSC